ncbi:MAG: hypothetical protein JST29_08980 [Bacteroidetes bacterium]|nr:hypothetical protein [Bacteroidota bacterium]MBS1591610.1 hypothetical protein [Bacteroidota bacterium]
MKKILLLPLVVLFAVSHSIAQVDTNAIDSKLLNKKKNTAYSNQLTLSFPIIWSNVKVKDNWTPTTSPSYKEYLTGTALGNGFNLNYSFSPSFIFKNLPNHFAINLGVGFLNQRFNIVRHFNYNSPLYPVYSTDYYSYECIQEAIGLNYNQILNQKFFITGNVSYSILQSFQQEYFVFHAPSNPPQVNYNQINFGKSLILNLGIYRNIWRNFSLGLNALVPLYTSWRNDQIFKDDPSTFYHPNFSIGGSVSITYKFKQKKQYKH